MKNKLSAAISAAIPFILLSTPIHTTQADSVKLTELGGLELSITANRRAQPIDKTLASVTVITSEDIENQQASSLQELLQARAGLQLVNNGGPGKVTSLFMRGTESDHTLILLDGVKINSGSTGSAPLYHLDVHMIDRIEIVHGVKTSLYGSDAIGGVIQIFTKKGNVGDSPKLIFNATAGSHDLVSTSIGVAGGFAKGHYGISVKSEKTDGYNACTGDSVLFTGCYTEELDDDGYENQSVSINLGYQLTKATKLSTNFMQSNSDVEYDGAAPFSANSSENTIKAYGLSVSSQLNEKAEIVFSTGHSESKNKTFQSGVFFRDYDTSRDNHSLQANIDLSAESLLTLGADYSVDKVDNVTIYSASDRKSKGIFAEYQTSIGKSMFQLGLRQDSSKQYGKQTTGNIGISHSYNEKLKLSASYGTAFKAPTFDELYFPAFGVPDMKPEETKTMEVGFSGKQSWGRWSTSIFRNNTDNLIVYKSDLSSGDNIDKAIIKGVEASVLTRFYGWDLEANLTVLDARDKSGKANDGKKLARRPDKSLRLNMDKSYGRYGFGASVIAESTRFDDAANNRGINGYATADIRTSYKLNKTVTLEAKIANIFDKKYETILEHPQDGRNFTVGITYKPR